MIWLLRWGQHMEHLTSLIQLQYSQNGYAKNLQYSLLPWQLSRCRPFWLVPLAVKYSTQPFSDLWPCCTFIPCHDLWPCCDLWVRVIHCSGLVFQAIFRIDGHPVGCTWLAPGRKWKSVSMVPCVVPRFYHYSRTNWIEWRCCLTQMCLFQNWSNPPTAGWITKITIERETDTIGSPLENIFFTISGVQSSGKYSECNCPALPFWRPVVHIKG